LSYSSAPCITGKHHLVRYWTDNSRRTGKVSIIHYDRGRPEGETQNIKRRQQPLEPHCLQCSPTGSLISKAQSSFDKLDTNLHLGIEIFHRLLWPLDLASWPSSARSRRGITAPVTRIIASVRSSCVNLQGYSNRPGRLCAISDNSSILRRGDARSETGGRGETRRVDNHLNLHGTLWRR